MTQNFQIPRQAALLAHQAQGDKFSNTGSDSGGAQGTSSPQNAVLPGRGSPQSCSPVLIVDVVPEPRCIDHSQLHPDPLLLNIYRNHSTRQHQSQRGDLGPQAPQGGFNGSPGDSGQKKTASNEVQRLVTRVPQFWVFHCLRGLSLSPIQNLNMLGGWGSWGGPSQGPGFPWPGLP